MRALVRDGRLGADASEDASVGRQQIDRLGADEATHRRQHRFDHLVGVRRRHQPADGAAGALLLRPPPHGPDDLRRGEAEQEDQRARDREAVDGNLKAVLVRGDQRREEQRGGERERREAEQAHPVAGHAGLVASGGPEAVCGDRGQAPELQDEGVDVDREPDRAVLTGRRNIGEQNRPDRQGGGRHGGEPVDSPGGIERGREADQEVGEQDQRDDERSLRHDLRVRGGILRKELPDERHRAQRAEAEGGPETRPAAAPQPEGERDGSRAARTQPH